MKPVLAALRSLGILLAVWGTLAAIGWLAGALPPARGGRQVTPANVAPADSRAQRAVRESRPARREDVGASESAATRVETAPSAVEPRPTPGPHGERTESPTPAAVPPEPDEPSGSREAPVERLARWSACAERGTAVVLALGSVIGDARPEILVGCEGRLEVLVLETTLRGPQGGAPIRVATFHAGPRDGSARLLPGRPAVGDVDGDGLADLVVAFAEVGPDSGQLSPSPSPPSRRWSGTPSRGGLWLLRRAESGAFEEPRALALAGFIAAHVAPMDSRGGLDVVALGTSSPRLRRQAELTVLTGGASPVRVATVRGSHDTADVALVDLDRDGRRDLVLALRDESAVRLHTATEAGFASSAHAVALAGARRLLPADVDGDGVEEVLALGESGLAVVRWSAGALEAAALPLDETEVRDVALGDVDGDGRVDLVAAVADALVVRRPVRGEAQRTERHDALSGVVAVALGDLDADARLDAVLLVDSGRDLVFVPSIGTPRAVELASSSSPLPVAPLSLEIALR
ncbi:MAG: FG-GAP-like repeat-containing protein [Myxococcota bacterium]|nr:FG-GAP-like repeat-containing protein [Myxococcota bacterium]